MINWRDIASLQIFKQFILKPNATFTVTNPDTGVSNSLSAVDLAPLDVSARVVTLAVTTSITQNAHEGRTVRMTGAGAARTFTLPAATGTGARYRFVVGEVNTSNYVIKVADATDIMYGNVITNSTGDTPDLAQPWPTAADSDTITLNGTTTGGVAIGDFIELEDIATNTWAVYGVTTSSGTEATPFSATV